MLGAFFDEQGNSNYATPGFQTGMQKLVDLYQKGYAPKESIAWGYADSVAGFASGTCAINMRVLTTDKVAAYRMPMIKSSANGMTIARRRLAC